MPSQRPPRQVRFRALVPAALMVLPVAFGHPRVDAAPAKPAAAVRQPERGQNVLSARAQRGQLTIGQLALAVGSPDAGTRRRAAETVVAIRSHYIAVAREVAERGFAGKAGQQAIWSALRTLAVLRATDARVLRLAADHLSFRWTPIAGGESDFFTLAMPATDVLVRASLAALPVLSARIAAGSPPRDAKHLAGDGALTLACAVAILGPATSAWLRDEAARTSDRRAAGVLRQCAAAIEPGLASERYQNVPHILGRFGAARAVESEYPNPSPIPCQAAWEPRGARRIAVSPGWFAHQIGERTVVASGPVTVAARQFVSNLAKFR